MTAATDTAPIRGNTAFIGHPTGLGWLAFSEFWERFSYYGMTALLVLYMTHSLLTPGHIEHIGGFTPFRSFIAFIYGGDARGQALASHIYGFYTAFVYLTPIAGGILADRFIGRTNAIILGASLMAMGHFLMTFDATFLAALLCLLLGTGCFKGNISGQVGDLYHKDDPRRADGFQIFMFFIQIAVIFSPFICGRLAAAYGWPWGFATAGFGMLIGLTIYLSGRKAMPVEPPRKERATPAERPPLTRSDWVKIAVLALLVPVLAVAAIGNQQIFNAYLVWGEANYQLSLFGMMMPITDLLSYGSIISAATVAASVAFWRWWATRWTEPDEITKITIGVALSASAVLLLAVASTLVATHGGKASLGWAIAFEIVNDLGFSNVFPVGLALYSRAAPKGFTGVMIGIYFLHLFIGNLLVGWLGGFLEKMPATSFWLMHAILIFGAAGVLLLVRFLAGRILAPAYTEAEMAIERAP